LLGCRPSAGALPHRADGVDTEEIQRRNDPEKYRRPTINTTAEAPATRTTTAWEILSAAELSRHGPTVASAPVADFTLGG
jgi:hypothetical protein